MITIYDITNKAHIILNIGTNDLSGDTPKGIVEKILGLADMITSKGIKCNMSLYLLLEITNYGTKVSV